MYPSSESSGDPGSLTALFDLPETPRWVLIDVGKLWLEHTRYTILCKSANSGFLVCYDGDGVALAPTINHAHSGVLAHMDQMFEMGFDPFTES